ncbi:hemagglutinin repeat-containing protein, partial [Kiloniella laminariae]
NEEHKVKQVGLTLSLKQNVTAAAKAVAGLPKAATAGEGSAGAKGLTAASAALKAVGEVAALKNGAVSAEISLGVSSSEEETSEVISSARVAQVQAGRDVKVTAGEDITGEGLQVTAGRDVTLDAGDDITLTAAQSTYALDH